MSSWVFLFAFAFEADFFPGVSVRFSVGLGMWAGRLCREDCISGVVWKWLGGSRLQHTKALAPPTPTLCMRDVLLLCKVSPAKAHQTQAANICSMQTHHLWCFTVSERKPCVEWEWREGGEGEKVCEKSQQKREMPISIAPRWEICCSEPHRQPCALPTSHQTLMTGVCVYVFVCVRERLQTCQIVLLWMLF